MTLVDWRAREVMEIYNRTGSVTRTAELAQVDRGTAAKYIKGGKLPSELARPRAYRTRDNPFDSVWHEVEGMLLDAPELQAKSVFEYLMGRQMVRAEALRQAHGEEAADDLVQFDPGQLRTFQRHVKQWRALLGPDKEVFFSQEHTPGEAMQTDFTWATELSVTIEGEPLAHMLCHSVLPYSNWQWATICRSENFVALRQGVQNAMFKLGRRTRYHQTDQSSTATHKVGNHTEFNDDYVAFMNHLGLKPRTIGVGKKEQNGDIEAANGALKRKMNQHLLLRGDREFETLDDYRGFLEGVLHGANKLRHKRLATELQAMTVLNASRIPDYKPVRMRVSQGSTIRVKENTYSVPSRLKGEQIDVRIYDGYIEVWYAQKLQLTMTRLLGKKGFNVNYRHIIWSMVRKPGSFRNYRYREAMFPTLVFRAAFDAIEHRVGAGRTADLQYLRILHLAAATMECEVEVALTLLLEDGQTVTCDAVKELVGEKNQVEVPALKPAKVVLDVFDAILTYTGGTA